jgi:hypothetical protein
VKYSIIEHCINCGVNNIKGSHVSYGEVKSGGKNCGNATNPFSWLNTIPFMCSESLLSFLFEVRIISYGL